MQPATAALAGHGVAAFAMTRSTDMLRAVGRTMADFDCFSEHIRIATRAGQEASRRLGARVEHAAAG